jgi:hypothetical protein
MYLHLRKMLCKGHSMELYLRKIYLNMNKMQLNGRKSKVNTNKTNVQHHTMHLTGNKTDEHRRSIRWNILKNHALTCKIHEKPHSIPLKRRKTGKNGS